MFRLWKLRQCVALTSNELHGVNFQEKVLFIRIMFIHVTRTDRNYIDIQCESHRTHGKGRSHNPVPLASVCHPWMTRTLSLAVAPFCFNLLTPRLNRFLLWWILLVLLTELSLRSCTGTRHPIQNNAECFRFYRRHLDNTRARSGRQQSYDSR